jgi:predicted HicB family RNase H-like nuclease
VAQTQNLYGNHQDEQLAIAAQAEGKSINTVAQEALQLRVAS